jgi:predicted acylesterase/phospholipase RssA
MRAGTAVALALFCLYAFICAAIDLGFGRALFGTFVIIVAFAVVFAYVSHLVQHWTAVGLFLVFVAVWFWIGSTRHPDIDAVLILVIMIATIIGWGKFLWGHADRQDSPGNSVIWLSAIAVAWIACSLTDRFLERTPQPRTSDRHAKNLDTTRWPGVRVGVTLSGGGYRATLMHAGTLDVLERLRVVPTHLASVSGGSITAGYYAAGGSPAEMLDAVLKRRLLLRRDLVEFPNIPHLFCQGHVPWLGFRLLPFCEELTRTDVQANLLDRVLFSGLRLDDLKPPAHPRLMICATDLLTGDAMGLTDDGVVIKPIQRGKDKYAYANPDLFDRVRERQTPGLAEPAFMTNVNKGFPARASLAQLVAASGAFPGAFAPIPAKLVLDSGVLFDRRRGVESVMGQTSLLLADAGLSDNSGVLLLLEANAAAAAHPDKSVGGWRVDVVIVSNAEMGFHASPELSSMWQQLSQVADVVYANTGMRKASTSDPLLWLSGPYIFDDHRFWNYLRTASQASPEAIRRLESFIPFKKSGDPLTAPLVSLLESRIPVADPDFLRVLREIEWRGRSDTERWRKVLEDHSVAVDTRNIAVSELLAAFSADLVDAVDRFDRFSTLNDEIAPDAAMAVYRLGQLLVLLDWPKLRAELDRFVHEGEHL